MEPSIADVTMTTWAWLGVMMVIWLIMAVLRPVQTLIIVGVSFFFTLVHPIGDMVFWTIVYGLFATTLGRIIIVAFGLGFIIEYTDYFKGNKN